MKKSILFLADETEPNLHHLMLCAEDRKLNFRLLSPYRQVGAGVDITISQNSRRYLFPDNSNEVFDLDEVAAIWSRGISVPPSPQRGTPENLAFHERLALAHHVYENLASRFWMNDLNAIFLASSRLGQMALARKHGFSVPETIVTNVPSRAKEFLQRKEKLIVKHISAGSPSSMGDRSLFTVAVGLDDMDVLDQVVYCPTLLQEMIEKEVELRVTVVGKRVFAAGLETNKSSITEIDSRRWTESNLTYFRARLDSSIEERIVALIKDLNLEYGAVDFIVRPDGELFFLEVNPSGQWGYVEMASGYAITDAIVSQLQEKLYA